MKIIDLLNKIANGEGVPIKLLAFGKHYEWKQPVKDYMNEDGDYLIEELISVDLNSICEEIPLIEEDKKIEKLIEPIASEYTYDYAKKICHKINEIIDVINRGD